MRSSVRCASVSAGVLSACVGWAVAQPTGFLNLGAIPAPASPPLAQEPVDTSAWFDFGNDTLTVKWAKLTLPTAISGDLFLDVSAWVYSPGEDTVLALYDASGNLVAFDDATPPGNLTGAGLSFGSTAERVPFLDTALRGQSGSWLPAGTYWLALAAGSLGAVTVGPTNWGITTTDSIELDYGDPGTYIEVYIAAGNTTLPPPPGNNDCANALVIGEDNGATPAWSGDNLGATQDGFGPCHSNISNLTTKDIWFSYVPTQTGWAQAVLTGGAGGGALPQLTRYETGCGSAAVQCAGGGNFDFGEGTRLAFPVVQGQPVLIAAAIRAGEYGPLVLNIDLVPPPCDLQTPAGAIPEIESACGAAENNGCNATPRVFNPITPGQVVSGSLFTNRFAKDYDWYQFTLDQAATVQFEYRSQLPLTVAIFNGPQVPEACFGPSPVFRRNTDLLNPCGLTAGSAPLLPGTYFLALTHNYPDRFDCGSGYNDYWVRLSSTPCDAPTYTSQPAPTNACRGGSATFSASATSPQPIAWTWEWRERDSGFTWQTIPNGEFSDANSTARVSGANSPTLRITGIDAPLNIEVRSRATTCASVPSAVAPLVVCVADVDNGNGAGICDGGVSIEDLLYYLDRFAIGATRADVDDGSGTGTPDDGVTIEDLLYYLQRFSDGC